MSGSSVEIRDATDADWPAIWPFLSEILASGETYCWPRETSEPAARVWWMRRPNARVLVAVKDGRIVGTAEFAPNQPGGGEHVANASFMVAPDAAGHGIGRALAERVLEAAAQDGYLAMQFNAVVETNENAIRLWRSLGFEVLATVPRAFRHPTRGLVGLHVMHRAL